MKRTNPFRVIYDSDDYKSAMIGSFPEIIDIELTNNCNLHCKMCSRGRMTRVKGFMSEETFGKIANECVTHNTPIRMIGWGEPFLHPKIIDFCRLYKNNIFRNIHGNTPLLHITNNGHIITEQQMKDLVEIGVDSIIFSFQGATQQGYEDMRIGASYDKIKNNILKLIEIRGENEKPFIQITSTMTNETEEEIHQFVNYWSTIVDYVETGKTQFPIEEKEGQMIQYLPCLEVCHKLTVKWDGRVSACCGDFNNTLTIGSIAQDIGQRKTLFELWQSKQIQAVRTLLANNNYRALTLCKECNHAYDNFL